MEYYDHKIMITKERIENMGGGTTRAKGFTLIEILIVVAIIAILASVVLVGLGPTQKQGRDSRRISDLQGVQNALELYYNHCGWYPGAADCGATYTGDTSYSDMSAALTGTASIGVPQVPVDPTNVSPYQYQYGSMAVNSYTLAAQLEDSSNVVMKSSISGSSNGITGCGTAGLYCIGL
jgi:prepilin-type N-terminal cleavage/methylation domain-containing protein